MDRSFDILTVVPIYHIFTILLSCIIKILSLKNIFNLILLNICQNNSSKSLLTLDHEECILLADDSVMHKHQYPNISIGITYLLLHPQKDSPLHSSPFCSTSHHSYPIHSTHIHSALLLFTSQDFFQTHLEFLESGYFCFLTIILYFALFIKNSPNF